MTKFQTIWQNYRDKMVSFTRSKVNDAEAANDIVQDVFVKILKKQSEIATIKRLDSWIYQITRNAIIDYYRTQKSHLEMPDEFLSEHTSYDAEKKQIALCLSPMLEMLPEKYKIAVKQADFQGFSQQEIAEMNNISLSGAKSRVQRGRAMLKNIYLDCCEIVTDKFGEVYDYLPNEFDDC